MRHPPYVLPRLLILLGALWLIGSWMLSLGLRPPVHQSSASYEPGVRLMLLTLALGLIIGWPLVRLSQARIDAPRRQVVLDMIVIVSMLQVVIWPIRLVTTWSVTRTAVLDGTLTGWIMIVGAVLAVTIGSPRGGPRILGMLACIAIALAAPTIRVLASIADADVGKLAYLSPFTAIVELTDSGSAPISPRHWRETIALVAAAGGAWMAVLVAARIVPRHHRDGAQTAETT